jgi:hypothetical protein
MTTRLTSGLVTFALFTITAGSAVAAQGARSWPVLNAGHAVSGTLVESDPSMTSRGRFQVYRIEAQAGERYVITMRSEAFDAYLTIARDLGGITDAIITDDDGGGGTDARVLFRPVTTGSYLVIAQAYGEDGVGAFTLQVEQLGPPMPATPRDIRVGETVSAELTDNDAMLDDEAHFHLYHLRGQPGQRVAITMRSEALDSYLYVGRIANGAFDEVARDDDSGGGLDARINLTLQDSDVYAIRATTLGLSTGPYTLSVAELPPPSPPPPPRPIRVGDEVQGALTEAHPQTDDMKYYEDFVLRGEAGQRARVSLRSGEFDAVVRLGRIVDGRFDELAMDDDGGEGTDSLLEFQLPEAGDYVIRATTFGANTTGAYTLSLEMLR